MLGLSPKNRHLPLAWSTDLFNCSWNKNHLQNHHTLENHPTTYCPIIDGFYWHSIDILIYVAQTTKTLLAFLRFLLQSLSCPFIHCLHTCVCVLDENNCFSIFIWTFLSHYWPAFRLWSAMHHMLQSTLNLMWPLLLTHWQCNLTRLMTCSMTSLCQASRSQPLWRVLVRVLFEQQDPLVNSLGHKSN